MNMLVLALTWGCGFCVGALIVGRRPAQPVAYRRGWQDGWNAAREDVIRYTSNALKR